ncbi:glycosyltransferase [Pedobacter sp.]|uniref:glycosyltransferase family A protein n=1 Tax=Pedobacter sp. TaxID=1411316 RepID=UPI0033919CA0
MDFQSQFPLISCICVTDNRVEMLYKCIISFEQQNYPNKELVISYPQTDYKTQQFVQHLLDYRSVPIIGVKRDKNESIGMARNNAIAIATGVYVCMWDDDDLYEESRLIVQYTTLNSDGRLFQANVLSQILLYHQFNQTAYLSFPSYWACTLLCRKDHLVQYPCLDADQFEYAGILNFLNNNQLLCSIPAPSLYISVFHGRNLIRYSTFLFLVNQSETIPTEISDSIKHHLEWQVQLPVEII